MVRFSVLTLLLLLVAIAPGAFAQDDDRLQIVASYSILADVVSNVAGDAADVSSLLPVDADPHTFVPTARDLTALVDADVVFVNGARFEEGLLDSMQEAGDNINIVTASECVRILPFGAGGHAHDHDDDDHSDSEHADDEHMHADDMASSIVSAAYMQITNNTGSDDTLIAARVADINTIEIHETAIEDGVARMRQLEDGIALPAGAQTNLRPGGMHIMLMDIQRDLLEGNELLLTLAFASGREITVIVQIQELPLDDGTTFDAEGFTISNVWARPTAIEVAAEAEHDHEEDHDHADEHMEDGEMSAIAMLCAQHLAEMDAIHEAGHEDGDHAEEDHAEETAGEHSDEGHSDDEHDHAHGNPIEEQAIGMLYAIECEGHTHSDEEHADEEHADEEHADEEHDHEHGDCDPHVWMEPHNAMYWTMLVRDTLVELDPSNAETYTANAAEYLLTLDALAHDFVMPMVDTVPEANRVLVTNHEFLGYFAVRYGFEVVGTVIPGGGTAAEPSAADVTNLIDTINEEGVSAIFTETSVRADIAEQIAQETGAQIVTLYSGSLSATDGPASTYVDYIRHNVTTIVESLGGGMDMAASN